MKELLIVIMLVVLTLLSQSQRPINKQPTTNSKIVVENSKEQSEEISHKSAILKTDKTFSRGGTGLEQEENVILLARLIQSEALSESYLGKLAVGSVVLNRMEEYNANMKDVIYSKYQFSGVGGELFNQYPSVECIQAAGEVLNGSRPVNTATYFVDLTVVKPSWTKQMQFIKKIGHHWFYKSK